MYAGSLSRFHRVVRPLGPSDFGRFILRALFSSTGVGGFGLGRFGLSLELLGGLFFGR